MWRLIPAQMRRLHSLNPYLWTCIAPQIKVSSQSTSNDMLQSMLFGSHRFHHTISVCYPETSHQEQIASDLSAFRNASL